MVSRRSLARVLLPLSLWCAAPSALSADDGAATATPPAPTSTPQVDGAAATADAARDGRALARVLFERGVELASRGAWREADETFRRSRALVPRPSTLFNLALSSYHLGRLSDCERFAGEFVAQAHPEQHADDLREVRALRERARAMMGVLVLTVTPALARVWVNDDERPGGARRELMLDPGTHRIRVEAPEHDPVQLDLELARSQRVERAIELAPRATERTARARPPSPRSDPRLAPDREPSDDGYSLLEDWRLWAVAGVVVASATTALVLLSDGDSQGAFAGHQVTLRVMP